MSWILSWWSRTTHLSVRSSFLPDLNLTRDNDAQCSGESLPSPRSRQYVASVQPLSANTATQLPAEYFHQIKAPTLLK